MFDDLVSQVLKAKPRQKPRYGNAEEAVKQLLIKARDEDRWLSIEDVMRETQLSYTTTSSVLNRLRRSGHIERKMSQKISFWRHS